MRKSINFWSAFHEHPPLLVRLLARRREPGRAVAAVSTEEIAIMSGIPLARVREISNEQNWDTVSISEAERFCLGCSFDPTNPKDRNRLRAYKASCQKNPSRKWFSYLRNSPWFASEFEPLIQKYKSTFRTKSSAPSALPHYPGMN